MVSTEEMVSMEGMAVMECLVQEGKRETQEFGDPKGDMDLQVYKNQNENANKTSVDLHLFKSCDPF